MRLVNRRGSIRVPITEWVMIEMKFTIVILKILIATFGVNAHSSDNRVEDLRLAVLEFDTAMRRNGSAVTVSEIFRQAADGGNPTVILESNGSWGFSVSGVASQTIRYYTTNKTQSVICELDDVLYDGLGLEVSEQDELPIPTHQKIIVAEVVDNVFKADVYSMSSPTVDFLISYSRIALLTMMVENCELKTERI